jgi:transcriptional regulator with XRE-family HTH domain
MRQLGREDISFIASRAGHGLPLLNGYHGNSLVINRKDLDDNMLLWADIIICGTNKTRDEINARVRKLKGYTQEELGNIIGVSKMAISKYERNIIDNIERKKIMALSKTLDIPISSFLKDILEHTPDNDKEQITPSEFLTEVRILLEKTENLTDQQKEHLLANLNFICSEEK